MVKNPTETRSDTWLSRKLRHVCDRGFPRTLDEPVRNVTSCSGYPQVLF